ncbi:MAG TPA: GtrA family protein [Paludibacter sp.]|nr:GtrA family protein [Paludibacter sp.]
MKIFNQVFVFAKAQFSALIGGLTDYMIMILFTEIFHVHYTISIALGGIVGAIINFSLNKIWTFHTKDIPYENSFLKQLMKFTLIVLNSILLKSTGTYFITTIIGFDYKISRIFTDLFVSIVFNYTLQRFWVFKQQVKVKKIL